MEFNETWHEARSQRILPSLCFFGPIRKTRWPPCLWMAETFSTSPLNGIQWNLTGSKISPSSICVFRADRKNKMATRPLIGWYIFDFSSETAEWISTKLDMKQDLNVLYQVCVFRANRKTKMAAPASDWLRHFRLLETAERNSTELDKKQDLNVLYQICAFQDDQYTKIAALTDPTKSCHIVLRCTICGHLVLLLNVVPPPLDTGSSSYCSFYHASN